MKRWLLTLELLASLAALTGVAHAQGRFGGGGGGDFRGGGGGGSGNSGGSTSVHSAGPSSAPAVVSRPGPPVSRPPVVSQPPVVSRPPVVVVQPQRGPYNPGNGSSLPSVNVPSRPRSAVQFQTPVNPSVQRGPREDFLGFHGEPSGVRNGNPNRAFPPNQQTVNRFVNPNLPSSVSNANPQVRFQGNVPRTVVPNIPRKAAPAARSLPPEQQQAAVAKFSESARNWRAAQAPNVEAFRANRVAQWNQIQQPARGAAWFHQANTPQYHQWYHAAWDYRRARAQEVWMHSHDLHNNLFNRSWWASVPWRNRPWGLNGYASPWWWWRSSSWADESAFFGPDLGSEPLAYDPGMNVFYDDNYNVDGQDLESANDAREQAEALANAPVDETPVPEPAPDGQPEQWLPLGSWALTQQEQGDPVIYFQISVDRNGMIGGAYRNALTNEQQPIIGRLDKRQQRLAWHIPSNPQTVFETGLTSLDYDVANVFVHFGTSQTQTWLLVRLPSPENPPDSVDVPDQPE